MSKLQAASEFVGGSGSARRLILLVWGFLLSGAPCSGQDAGGTHSGSAAPIDAPANARRLPGNFIENRGQWDSPIRFASHGSTPRAWFGDHSWTMLLEQRVGRTAIMGPPATREPGDLRRQGVALALTSENASPDCGPVGAHPSGTWFSYFPDNDPARWKGHIPGATQLRYSGIQNGVDVVVRSEGGGLEYDVLVAPGANLDRIVIRCDGADRIAIDADGSLLFRTLLGVVRQPLPRSWEVLPGGEQRPIEVQYRVIDAVRFGFAADAHDPSLSMVVDPGLVWSAVVGGYSGADAFLDVLMEPGGDVLLSGGTTANDFPTTPGAYLSSGTGVILARVNSAGTALVFATYLGSGSGQSIAHAGTDIVVAGSTYSGVFPTTPGAFNTMFQGNPT